MFTKIDDLGKDHWLLLSHKASTQTLKHTNGTVDALPISILTCRSCTPTLTKRTKLNWKAMSFLQFTSVVQSCPTLWPHGPQHARPPCPSPTPRAYSNLCPLSQWCHPTIYPLLSPYPPTFNLSQHQGLFKWVSSSHQVVKVLEFQLQHQSLQWTPKTDLF